MNRPYVFTNRAVSTSPDHARAVYLATRRPSVPAAPLRRRDDADRWRAAGAGAVAALAVVAGLVGLGWWVVDAVHGWWSDGSGASVVARWLLPTALGGGGGITITVCRHRSRHTH